MPLACWCDAEDADWFFERAWLDKPMPAMKRRKRCCSCKNLIDEGDTCTKYTRWRYPNCDIEEWIYGDAVGLAAYYQCEECSDLMENLAELGFDCIGPDEDMRELIEEYRYDFQGLE